MKIYRGLLLLCSLVVVMSGCQSKGTEVATTESAVKKEAAAEPQKPPQPVTLKIGFRPAAEPDVDIMIEAAKKKYPHITIEKLPGSNSVTEMLTRGDKPDLLQIAWTELVPMTETGLAYDMTPLMKQNNFDMNSFRDGYLANVRGLFLKPEELIAVQYYTNTGLMYYNKDIFDRFGVPYPKDGMTWEDVTELARKVTQSKDGVQYQGLEARNNARLDDFKSQLGLNFINPKTGKSDMTSDGWKYFMETLVKQAQIPGNEKSLGTDGFTKTFQVAMLPWRDNLMGQMFDTKGLNWDIVTFPTFSKAPGVNTNFAGPLVAITSLSQHKQEAFQFIQAALSEDVQKKMASMLRVPVMKGMDKYYGLDYPAASTKNLQAVFKLQPGPHPYVSVFNNEGRNLIAPAFEEIIKGKDINTALREIDEKLNQVIQKGGK